MEFRIPEPCPEPWEQMEPRPEGRHCARCDRTLIDFSVMPRSRAEAVARGLEGPVCGRLAVDRTTGEPWFPPEASVAPRWAGGVVLAAALTLGCGSSERRAASAELAEVAPEPEAPPMQPVELTAAPTAPVAETRAVPVEELDVSESGQSAAAEPTPEQRRLTAAKRARLAAPAYPPNIHAISGFF